MLTGLGGALAAAGVTAARLPRGHAEEASSDPADRRLLFVVCAAGGGSIIDSFMPVATTEVPEDVDASILNVYSESQLFTPEGSNIRCVRPLDDTLFLTPGYSIQQFLTDHYTDMTVVGHEVTSVNHNVAQKRAMTGAGINRGRTIAEAVAERYGLDLPLANCNMGNGGYVEPGDDATLLARARAEIISDPRTYAVATHGSRGVAGGLSLEQVTRARSVREQLEGVSPFGITYRDAPRRSQYLYNRTEIAPQLESMDAITKLMLLDPSGLSGDFDLEASPMLDALRQVFPLLDGDNWHQQGALAFLLSYYGMSCANTLALSFNPSFDGDEITGAPLAFDFSHTAHRPAQNVMWGRVLQIVSGLVKLLKAFDYMGDPALGKMWDRSLIYVATEFGRDKLRPSGGSSTYGTGHHLNNGTVLLSPMLQGNRVFGGVDPSTLLTYGFDTGTGEPLPGTVLREGEIYSAIAQALGIDFTGRRDMSALMI
ncbi:hypothetical protein G6O69_32715 [Pseudenhygromyxa sp. WMMC2535]|nr:hypothetical protein [Pseudenhygromyxa sp. WMMC2535]